MTNRTVIDADLRSYNRSIFQPETRLLSFKVCELKRHQRSYMYIDSYLSDTIERLKDKIALYLSITVPLDKFFLEVFDEITGRWMKIGNEYSSYTIRQLNLHPDSTISVEYCGYEVSRGERSLNSTSAFNDKRELTLKLCKDPMDRTESTYLFINSDSTLEKLREQAYEKLNKSITNRPLYRWNGDTWMKFDFELDNQSLADLGFQSYTFISIDYDENHSTSKFPAGLCGLANLGSTCFMNSVFQCLSSIPEFTEKMLAFNEEVNAPVIGGYIQLMKQMWSGKSGSIEPALLVSHIGEHLPHYVSYRQQDAQEFMNHFLHLIHAELSTKETIITELFYGHIQSTVKCLGCQAIEKTNESISFLPLPISNHNLRTILYLKADGEQRLVSVQVNSSVNYVGALIDYFIKQHDPTLTRERIRAIQLIDNRLKKILDTYDSLTDISDNELAFLERPDKSYRDTYIWCDFVVRSTNKSFRPSIVLIGPNYTCRYSDLSEQIEQILGHLCSMTGAPLSACQLHWQDRDDRQYKLTVKDDRDEDLPYVKRVIIELTSEFADIYKQHYDFNRSTDNSGLVSLLDDFFHEEPLDGDYQCLKCSKRTKARQKSDLCLPLPRVLIIQLKRFTYDSRSNDKIDTFISFPLHELDLNAHIVKEATSQTSVQNSSTKYNLVAVSNHTGSLSSGHYTTYAKNHQDQNWYLFDDRFVQKLNDEKDVITKNAYILVYVQKPSS